MKCVAFAPGQFGLARLLSSRRNADIIHPDRPRLSLNRGAHLTTLSRTAPAFVEMAHRIVWCTAATVDASGRPRSRVLHPIWRWDGDQLEGFVATEATATKRSHLDASPHISLNYWNPTHDTCVAECRARWAFDDETRAMVWELFRNGPEPVGYDPAMIQNWDGPTSESFAALRLDPWRLRVFPGTVLTEQRGEILTWSE